MPIKQGTQLIFKVYLRDHLRQLKYSKQYMIETYFSSLSISTHEANLLKVATKNNLRLSAHGIYHR